MGCTATAKLDGEAARAGVAANDNAVPGARVAWYRNYHRYYDPAIGRYTQVDPLHLTAPVVGHPYGYAGSNPLTWVDPRGLFKWKGAGTNSPCLQVLRREAQFWRWNVQLVRDLHFFTGASINEISAGLTDGSGPSVWVLPCNDPTDLGQIDRIGNLYQIRLCSGRLDQCCRDWEQLEATLLHEFIHYLTDLRDTNCVAPPGQYGMSCRRGEFPEDFVNSWFGF